MRVMVSRWTNLFVFRSCSRLEARSSLLSPTSCTPRRNPATTSGKHRQGGARHLPALDLVPLDALQHDAALVTGLALVQGLVEHLDAGNGGLERLLLPTLGMQAQQGRKGGVRFERPKRIAFVLQAAI